MVERVVLAAESTSDHVLERFDAVAADLFPQYSRAVLQGWIRSGELTLNGARVKASKKLSGGETLSIDATMESLDLTAEPLPLDIVHEDASLLVLNKPAGLVVHPGAGNPSGTLLNGLLYHDSSLSSLPRAGIVHRLDKDTTGLMVVARTSESYYRLVSMLSERQVTREYEAVVHGSAPESGIVDEPIGRHRSQRTRMAVTFRGKEAITHFRILARIGHCSHLGLRLETGRTHQIRVHLQHIGFPLVGDPVYGRKGGLDFHRQALHARRLSFRHPIHDKEMSFDQPLPEDMALLLDELREFA